MGRILAIDLGEKRVGLALSDPLKIIASPYKTIHLNKQKDLLDEILVLIKQKQIELVVIGLPLHKNGREGEGCKKARALLKKIQSNNIKAVLWDERYSSKQAQSVIHKSGVKLKKVKHRIDMIAAALILKSYLREKQT